MGNNIKLDFFRGLTQKELLSPVTEYAIPVETSFEHDMLIGEFLKSIQDKEVSHEARYFYAIDKENRLFGVVATRDILFSNHEKRLSEIAIKHVITINYKATLEQALLLMTKHKLMALPLVDEENKLHGIIEISTKTFALANKSDGKPEADVFQLIGLSVAQGKLTSSVKEFRYRMPWLSCNVAAGLICAFIASFFYELLQAVVVISMFIPLVLTLAESISMQSMTLSLQFLHFGKIPWHHVGRRIIIEWKASVLLGIACAALVTGFYFAWFAGVWPIVAIASSIFLSMLAATTFGCIFPVILHYFMLDPRLASGPMVLMITDVTATLTYYSLSSWLLL